MWNLRLTKVNISEKNVHHVVECYMSYVIGESTEVLANTIGRIGFRTKLPLFQPTTFDHIPFLG